MTSETENLPLLRRLLTPESWPAGTMINRILSLKGAVLVALGLYAIVWTIVPILSDAAIPGDSVEIIAWGREWLAGIYRHPPMKAWLAEIFYLSSGRWEQSVYLLSALAFGLSQLAIYGTLRTQFDRRFSLTAIFLAPTIYYFGMHLPQWNANVAQYPFAGLLLLVAWRALNQETIVWWFAAGLVAACGVLSKYTFILLPAAIFLAAITNSALRSRIHLPGLVVAAVTFTVLLIPHLIWLNDNLEVVQTYASQRLAVAPVSFGWIVSPLAVIALAFGIAIVPGLFAAFAVAGEASPSPEPERGELTWLIGWMAVFPVLVGAAIGSYTGTVLKDHWFLAYFLFFPAFLLLIFKGGTPEKLRWTRISEWIYLALLAVTILLYPAERIAYYQVRNAPHFWTPLMPVAPLAKEADLVWRKALDGAGWPDNTPLRIVAGPREAAQVATHHQNRPSWLENFDLPLSPWVALEDVTNFGVVVVGATSVDPAVYGLCIFARSDFDWRNSRGESGRVVPVTGYLPASECPE